MAVADGLARESVSDSVILAVDVTHGPRVTTVGKALAEVIAFHKENPKVSAMASPISVDTLNDKHGVQFKH